jgi:hypothetical protein
VHGQAAAKGDQDNEDGHADGDEGDRQHPQALPIKLPGPARNHLGPPGRVAIADHGVARVDRQQGDQLAKIRPGDGCPDLGPGQPAQSGVERRADLLAQQQAGNSSELLDGSRHGDQQGPQNGRQDQRMQDAQRVPCIEEEWGDTGDVETDREQDRGREGGVAAALQAEQHGLSASDQFARRKNVSDQCHLDDAGDRRSGNPLGQRLWCGLEAHSGVAHGLIINRTV